MPRVQPMWPSSAKPLRHDSFRDAIGKRIHITDGPETWREIVGIVGDTKHYGLNSESKSQMYEPMAQHPFTFMTFVVKTSGAPMALSRTVEARIQNGHWPLRRIRADALHGIRPLQHQNDRHSDLRRNFCNSRHRFFARLLRSGTPRIARGSRRRVASRVRYSQPNRRFQ